MFWRQNFCAHSFPVRLFSELVDILLQLRHEAANVVVVAIETLTPDKVMIIFFHW
jgi:hypothetical protein